MLKVSGDDFKSLRKSLIKQDKLAIHQLIVSLSDISYEHSINEEGRIENERL